jgi:hypothetical protein
MTECSLCHRMRCQRDDVCACPRAGVVRSPDALAQGLAVCRRCPAMLWDHTTPLMYWPTACTAFHTRHALTAVSLCSASHAANWPASRIGGWSGARPGGQAHLAAGDVRRGSPRRHAYRPGVSPSPGARCASLPHRRRAAMVVGHAGADRHARGDWCLPRAVPTWMNYA